MSYRLLRSLFFLLDPETAHYFATSQMARLQTMPSCLEGVEGIFRSRTARISRTVWGLEFQNPVGIAAGFDKNAELVAFLRALGFGFVEVGTITLRPQSGNPRPRMFRFPSQRALINRLGFNNDGAEVVARRLALIAEDDRATPERATPIFANIGKNRDVSLEDAPRAYLQTYRVIAPWVDGVVINVSSPNTPSLRDLQRPENLEEIIRILVAEREEVRFVRGGRHPILVKIAPDLTDGQLAEIAEVCRNLSDGMVATNTTVDHSLLGFDPGETGGLSGDPLFRTSTDLLRRLREAAGPGYPLIGVGGIRTGAQALEKLEAGADLIQAYTGFIYEGPSFPRRLMESLAKAEESRR